VLNTTNGQYRDFPEVLRRAFGRTAIDAQLVALDAPGDEGQHFTIRIWRDEAQAGA
jgi:hypothetical protein